MRQGYEMIICFLGGRGQGKTLSTIKTILDSAKIRNFPLTNFRLSNNIAYHRLELKDMITEGETEAGKKIIRPNWVFWEHVRKKYPSFSVYLDEAHNFVGSRSFMSPVNKACSKWASQSRKILNDSPENNLILITQYLNMIDLNFRLLSEWYVDCQKIKLGKTVYIYQTWYNGLQMYEIRRPSFKRRFLANPYFKYYDTKELVIFEDADVYL